MTDDIKTLMAMLLGGISSIGAYFTGIIDSMHIMDIAPFFSQEYFTMLVTSFLVGVCGAFGGLVVRVFHKSVLIIIVKIKSGEIKMKINDNLTAPTPKWAKYIRTLVYRIGGIPAIIGLFLWMLRHYFPGIYVPLPEELKALEDAFLVGGIGAFIINLSMQMTKATPSKHIIEEDMEEHRND